MHLTTGDMTMTDNIAVLQGYTEAAFMIGGCNEVPILYKPGTDLDSTFKAWACDNQEFITVNGWLCGYEHVTLQEALNG